MPREIYIERIYTDGACSGNPGPGGWGVVAYLNNGTVHELGGQESKTTNNRMELQAAIAAIQLLCSMRQTQPAILYTDSEYVKNGITKWISGWKKKNWKTSSGKAVVNLDLWQQLDELNEILKNHLSLTWEYVKGHAGNEGNERSDRIARGFSLNDPPALITTTLESSKSRTLETDNLSAKTKIESIESTGSQSKSVTTQFSSNSQFVTSTITPKSTSSSSELITKAAEAENHSPSLGSEKLHQLRTLVEIFQLADIIAEQHYLITTTELAELSGINTNTVTNRGESWIWRNWLVTRVRQESHQILWQLERVS